jgi:hypothetical protein
MTYAQTVDGQLHAFVLSKNDFSASDFNTKVQIRLARQQRAVDLRAAA